MSVSFGPVRRTRRTRPGTVPAGPFRRSGPGAGRRTVVVAGLAVLALLGGSPTPASAAPAPAAAAGSAAAVPQLDWAACDGGFQCATAQVPLDHRRPRDGRTVDLALVRWPAADPAKRLGTLFLNPGGPGQSGVSFLRTAPPIALQIASQRFDLVSWDPRGVGASATIRCGDYDFPAGLPRPDRFDEAEWIRASREFGRGCVRENPDLRFFSTADTARDLDLLRQAVGDEKLSYLGISYGTLIGSTYASLFPGKARALVLDAAVDPEVYLHRPLEARQEQAAAFERGLLRFFTACAGDQVACSGFGGSDPETAFDALVAKADANPIPAPDAPGARPLTGDDILDAAEDVVYSERLWRFFASALKAAQEGDGSLMQLLNQPGGGFSGDASVVIRALDQDYPRHPRPILDAGRFSGRAFPHFGWLSGALELPFGLLPVEAARPFRGPFRNPPGAAPVLVVGTTYDTATPYVWAQRLTAQLGNARLLTYAGDGHSATTDLNPCVMDGMFGFLETGTLPAEGTVCQQDGSFSPAAARTATVPDGWDWEIEAELH